MAAEAATFLAHCRTGDHIVCIGEVYGGTFELLGDNLPQLGITTTFLRADEADRLPEVLTDRTRIVFFETPANLTLTVFDIADLSARARAVGALTVVDNTFATPVNQNPLHHGADLVVHSATKYLGGHSDLTAGVLTGTAEHLAPVMGWRKNLGQIIAPETAFLLARSLRSLPVRVRAQNDTAKAVAAFLAAHPRVARVHYVDDVTAEPVHRGRYQAVVRPPLVSEPRTQIQTSHRIGGPGDLPVVRPADDVRADGGRGRQHVLALALRG